MLESERLQVVVIGGGQAGLSTGYHLARRGLRFVILEANPRIGDSWRKRWDSLRLFTPARFDGIAGMPFPAPAHSFPAKDEMADYLEAYAARFALPVRTGVAVELLSREGDRYLVTGDDRSFEAEHVVVAMASYQSPKLPPFAGELDPGVVQLHSSEYRNLSQLQPGGVLIVGAGNSGSEVALEAARGGHPAWMSGRDTGARAVSDRGGRGTAAVALHIPARLPPAADGGHADRPEGAAESPFAGRAAHPGQAQGSGRGLEVANVVWCTGFHPGFWWIDLPIFAGNGEPAHQRGIVAGEPGLYFVGLHFLYALSSTMIHGVERDAVRVADAIATRTRERTSP